MQIHYTKHHQAYIDKLNAALADYPELQIKEVDEILTNLSLLPEKIREAVRNHGGGHANHTLFWSVIGPQTDSEPSDSLGEAIRNEFGAFADFQARFVESALSRFGFGWVWLTVTKEGSLKLYSLPNQDSPLSQGEVPILGLDVWEHAYYLKYQNRRIDYANAFWNVVSWDEVEKKYIEAVA
jgi:Fe-Mn family superoxide dismutase